MFFQSQINLTEMSFFCYVVLCLKQSVMSKRMNHDDQHISDLITALFSKSLDEIGEQLLGCTERRGQ